MFLAVVEQQRKNYHNHSLKPKKLVADLRLAVLQVGHLILVLLILLLVLLLLLLYPGLLPPCSLPPLPGSLHQCPGTQGLLQDFPKWCLPAGAGAGQRYQGAGATAAAPPPRSPLKLSYTS